MRWATVIASVIVAGTTIGASVALSVRNAPERPVAIHAAPPTIKHLEARRYRVRVLLAEIAAEAQIRDRPDLVAASMRAQEIARSIAGDHGGAAMTKVEQHADALSDAVGLDGAEVRRRAAIGLLFGMTTLLVAALGGVMLRTERRHHSKIEIHQRMSA